MDKRGFKKLVVWQKAKELAVMVYKVTEGGPLGHDYGLRDQIRRSLDDVVDRCLRAMLYIYILI